MEPVRSSPYSEAPAPVPFLSQRNPFRTHTTWSILILSSHLRLGIPSGPFPSGLPTKTLYAPLLSPFVPQAPPFPFFSISSPEWYLVRSTDQRFDIHDRQLLNTLTNFHLKHLERDERCVSLFGTHGWWDVVSLKLIFTINIALPRPSQRQSINTRVSSDSAAILQFPIQWVLMRHDLLSEMLQYIWILLTDSKVTHMCADCEVSHALKSTAWNSQLLNRAYHMNSIHTSGLISSSYPNKLLW